MRISLAVRTTAEPTMHLLPRRTASNTLPFLGSYHLLEESLEAFSKGFVFDTAPTTHREELRNDELGLGDVARSIRLERSALAVRLRQARDVEALVART